MNKLQNYIQTNFLLGGFILGKKEICSKYLDYFLHVHAGFNLCDSKSFNLVILIQYHCNPLEWMDKGWLTLLFGK